MTQPQRIRHGARAALALGVVVSIVANVLHANGNIISQAIAAWAPVALLITIELIARIPVRSSWLSFARLVATSTIAGIAAWVSYWHMVGVALRYGETAGAAHLIPLTVDGLVVVAWVCLVEIGGRIREADASAERREDQPSKRSTPAVVAATARARRVRHGKALRRVVVTHPRPRVIAAQEARQDPRASHEIDLVVRALKLTVPNLSQRRIAQLAATSDATVRRALRRTGTEEPTQINGSVPALAGVGADEKES